MKTLSISNLILTQDKKSTYLTADIAAASSTLTVKSITGFAIAKILCVGEVGGGEDTEIIKTHASTAPTGTTITLASNTVYAHTQDTPAYLLDWDQVEVSHASTVSGDKSVLSTFAIQADQKETLYNDSAKTSGYYFTRFLNSIGTTTYTDYSDAIPYSGYADNTVWSIKDRALRLTGESIGDLITHDYLNICLWQARRIYHNSPGKRPFRKKQEADLGNVTPGQYRIAVPSDLQDPSSAKNIFNVRIGVEENMSAVDKKTIDTYYRGVATTTLSANYATADTYITLTGSRDFPQPSGSVTIAEDSIDYSANNVSAGSLTIDSAGDEAHSSGDRVWYNASYGLPSLFSVIYFNADSANYIVFNRPISTTYSNMNIWSDYYRTLVAYDSDADVLDEPEYDMFVFYLAWAIKKKRNEGLVPLEDPDYIEWLRLKENALETEYLGAEIKMVPDIAHLNE